ncbi:MAG: T9SS type A sorting domain-containing protein [Candidatus Margulisbacteria bacterium]|nr:T9SS type A sorting domain-containing protein [Candidatus Margulisiibacteriota bacterium]
MISNIKMSKILGGLVLTIALTLSFSSAAFATATTVSMNGTNVPPNQIYNSTGIGGTLLAAGKYVQFIQSSDGTAGAPDIATGLPAGDTVVSTGTLATPGNFAASANISANNFVYIRAWETWTGVGAPTGKYGTSVPVSVGSGFTFTYKPASFATTTSIPVQATLSSVSPASRGQGATNQNIILTGSNFQAGATAQFAGAGITVNSTTFNNATQVTANITIAQSAATGTGNVTVTNPGAPASAPQTFTVNAGPLATSTSLNSHDQGWSGSITVTGTNFHAGAWAPANVVFSGSGITVNSVTYNSATQLTVSMTIAGGATAGGRTITLTNPDDAGSLTSGSIFTVTVPAVPTVTGINPTSGTQGQSNLAVTITGANTIWSGDMKSSVQFSGAGITINSATASDTTHIAANISIDGAAAATQRTVTVTGAQGSATFTVIAAGQPTVTGISPISGNQGQSNLAVTITGANTNWVGDMKSSVQFSGAGITINSATATNPTNIAANISIDGAAAATARTVTVTGAQGSATFTVNAVGGPLTITTTSLPDGTVGTAYNQSLAATGGTTPYTWTLINATALPAGLTLAANGTISGSPTTAGTTNFTVQVADSAAHTATQALSINITTATTPTAIVIDDFEGGSVGTWSGLNPTSGYYTFGDGMMTPDNTNITAQGPDASAAKNGTKGMKVLFSYVHNADPNKDWGDGWGAALIKTLDLSAMKSVTMNIKWDGSSNDIKFGFQDSGKHVYVATIPNSTLAALSGYGQIAIPASSFKEDTDNPSRTPGAIDWTKITNYNFAYLNKGTTVNYQNIDDITARTTDEAIIPPPVTGEAPVITSLSPTAAPTGTKLMVSGSRFGSGQGSSTLVFENSVTHSTYTASITSWNDTSIEAIVPMLAPAGSYTVKVVRIAIQAGTVTALESNTTGFQVTSTSAGDIAVIYPNPFNAGKENVTIAVTNTGGATRIGFYIFDMTARLTYKYVATSGNQTTWNGYDQDNALVGDGAYLVRIVNEDTKALLAKGKILVVKH